MTLMNAATSMLASHEAATVALAGAKAAASAVCSAGAKSALKRVFGHSEARAAEDAIAMAFIRAIEESRFQAPDNEVSWWSRVGQQILRPFVDDAVASYVVTTAISDPQNRDAADEILIGALQHRGYNIGKLAEDLGIDVKQFLFLLPGTILDELIGAAVPDPAVRSLAEFASLRQLVSYLDAGRVAAMSPWELKEQLMRFLDLEHRLHRSVLAEFPYLPPDPAQQPLIIESLCRIGLRHGISDVAGLPNRASTVPAGRPTGPSDLEPTRISSLLTTHARVVVAADAGMGKTSLIHNEAAKLAWQAHQDLATNARDPADITIPLAVRCDTLAERQPLHLVEAACQVVAERHDLSPALRHWLVEHARTQSTVFLLDALDEVAAAKRDDVSTMIIRWKLSASSAGMVITSRMADYEGVGGSGFREAELLPFTVEDTHAYISSWGLGENAQAQLVDALRNPALASMARVPLLLALLCHLVSKAETLPTSRAGIYELIVRRFLRSEHHTGVSKTQSPSAFGGTQRQREQRLLQILCPLAFTFASAEGGWVEQMPTGAVLKALRDLAKDALLPAGVDAIDALHELSVNAGVLVPAGDAREGANPPYAFIHRSFAEYLIAQHLADDSERLLRFVDERRWIAPQWTQIWRLLGPLLTDPAPLLDSLLCTEPDPLHLALFSAAEVVSEIDQRRLIRVHAQVDQIARSLVELLSNSFARFEAAEALAAMTLSAPPETADSILRVLNESTEPQAQRAAIRALRQYPGADIDHALTQALSHPIVGVRQASVDALQERGGGETTRHLLNAMADTSFSRRYLVVQALRTHPDNTVTDALVAALHDDNYDVREYAVWALDDRPGDTITDALIAAIPNEPIPILAGSMATTLRNRPGQHVTDTLLALVTAPTAPHEVRLSAAFALRERAGQDITESLLTKLSNTSQGDDTRWYLFRALSTRPGEAVTDVLIKSLIDPTDTDRAVLAVELTDRHEQEITDALRAVLRDLDYTVRRDAASSLKGADDPAVTEALLQALQDDEDSTVRKAAAQSLARRSLTGQQHQQVADALLRALHDPDIDVCVAAASALADRPERRVTDALIAAMRANSQTNTATADPMAALRRVQAAAQLRQAIAGALAGRPGRDVTDALTAAAGDHDFGVRIAAISALTHRPDSAVTIALLDVLAADPDLRSANLALNALNARSNREITRWLRREAQREQVGRSYLYAVALNASRQWAVWPATDRADLLSALSEVTAAIDEPGSTDEPPETE